MIKFFILSLRGASIAARFLLSFLFVKYISLEFQGEYTLLLTTVTLMMLTVGVDFYVYSNRYMIKNKAETGFTLINQFVFHLLSYVILVLLFLVFNYFDIFAHYFTITIFILLVFEHLGMEFFRIFIALEKVLTANILLFIRTGIWPLILIYQLLFTEVDVTLNSVVFYWVLASVLTVIIGFILIHKEVIAEKFSLDKKWIKRGFNVGVLFFTATAAQKVIEFSDRYIIDAILGAKSLGIYTFYFQLANVANVAIFTVIISFLYPKIIYYVNIGDKKNAFATIKKLQKNSILFIAIYAVIIFLLLPYLLEFIDKSELNNHKVVLFLFLGGNLFLNLSFASHYSLMAIEKDKLLLKITILVAALNFGANILSVIYFGIEGAVIVFLISSILLYSLKQRAINKNFEKYEWKNEG